MAERHVARCDWAECGKEEALIATAVPGHWNGSGGFPMAGSSFSLPSGWRNIDGKTLCSWACIAKYAEHRASREQISNGAQTA